ncbi:uncharacterized protein PRCAT00002443001 [Priceomyces carsonii]|uniref:uncharacterized protein n=1 Tax=Priceomyces carsonii TaxID=28549 RepID=UPI002ED86BEF|nr:unnamed protein product [Priceomyces carsonii]
MSDDNTTEQTDSQSLIHPDNPLTHRLSPQQFQASIKFYEADQKLTPEDRLNLSNDLQSIVFKTAFVSYGSAVAAFGIPSFYNKFVAQPVPLKVRPLIYKPFLSFLLGLTTMMVVNQQTLKYQFQKKIDYYQGTLKTNQLNAWRAMDYHQASLFYVYYRRTADNPSFIISDPRNFTEKTLHEVHFAPPKHKNQHYTSALGIGHDGYDAAGSSTWERIRLANGFSSSLDNASDKSYPSNSDK